MPAVKRKNEKSASSAVAPKTKKVKVEKADNASTKKSKKPKKAPTPSPSPSASEDEWSSASEDDAEEPSEDAKIESKAESGDAMDVDTETVPGIAREGNEGKSRAAHAEQKKKVEERKAAKPHAEIIARSKKIWEQIRRTKMPAAERQTLIAELHTLTKGRVKELVFKHDSVRVIQTVLKYGGAAVRESIAQELKGSYVVLAQSQYGKWITAKTLHYGTPETRKMVIDEIYGNVRKLIKHKEAGFVVEDAYGRYATPEQKAALLREFYGLEYAIFKKQEGGKATTSQSLSDILEKTPEKRAVIMRSLFEVFQQCAEKEALFYTIVHKAMLEYVRNTTPGTTEATDFVELVKEKVGDIANTKDGSQVVMRCLALGSAKDRKAMIKALKPTSTSLAVHEHGYLVIIAALDVVDDTVMVSKAFLAEFAGHIEEMAADKFGRIPLLYPFAGRNARLLPPSALPILQEIDTIRERTSKKDALVRRKEHATAFTTPLLAVLENAESAALLTSSSFGCGFITELLLSPTATAAETLPAVLDNITALAAGDPTSDGHIATTAAGGRMLKTLVQGGHYNSKLKKVDVVQPPLRFASKLGPVVAESVKEWATGAGSFVVVALLETEDVDGWEDGRGELVKTLKKCKKDVQKAVDGGNKGAKVVLEKL